MISASHFSSLVAEQGVSLPEKYVQLLEKGQTQILSHEATGECQWHLLGLSAGDFGLFQQMEIGTKTFASWELPRGHASLLAEVGIETLNGPENLPVNDFRRGVAIAKCEGDHLFLLPDGSVWCFWHDGHEALRLADTWSEFAGSSLSREAGSCSVASNSTRALIGTWRPVSSRTESQEMFELIEPSLEFISNGTVVKRFPDGAVKEHQWNANEAIITFRVPEVVKEKWIIQDDELDLTDMDGGYHRHYVREN